jgi:hypothetical protein
MTPNPIPPPKNSHPSRHPGRSFVLWVLILGLLASALDGFLRTQAAIYSWDVLTQLGLTPGPLYAALSGAVWGIVSLAAALGLLRRRRWAPVFTRLGVAGLALWYWIDRLFLTRAPDAAVNTPFAAGATVVLVFYALGVLSLEQQKKFFKE